MIAPRSRDSAATRSALLEAARHAFTRYGYEGAGVREIAESVGVDKVLIVRYFGSKENLFAEAIPASFDPSPLLVEPRASFGEHVIRYLFECTAQGGFDPTVALLRSLSDPAASEHLRAGIQKRLVRPIAKWLGGTDAELRAAAIVAQIAGFQLMINVLPLHILLSHEREYVIQTLGSLLQVLADGQPVQGAIHEKHNESDFVPAIQQPSSMGNRRASRTRRKA